MNKRIKELAKEFAMHTETMSGIVTDYVFNLEELERFTELVRQVETKACAEHYLAIMRDSVKQAVLKEREACAKLCDDWLVKRDDICEVAKAIRARKETT